MMQNETLSGSGNVEPESGPAIKKSSTFLVTKCSVICIRSFILSKAPLNFLYYRNVTSSNPYCHFMSARLSYKPQPLSDPPAHELE